MKKLFPVLLLAMIIGLFSSCIIVTNQDDSETTYTFYFFNNTNEIIRDWYLIDRNDHIYSVHGDGFAEEVKKGNISSIEGLKARDYKVFYEYENSGSYTSGFFSIRQDSTFKVSENNCYSGVPRSAAN